MELFFTMFGYPAKFCCSVQGFINTQCSEWNLDCKLFFSYCGTDLLKQNVKMTESKHLLYLEIVMIANTS